VTKKSTPCIGLSHLCTLLKLLNGMRYYLKRTLVWPQLTHCIFNALERENFQLQVAAKPDIVAAAVMMPIVYCPL